MSPNFYGRFAFNLFSFTCFFYFTLVPTFNMHFTRFCFEYFPSMVALHRQSVCRIMLFSLVPKSFPQWLKFSRLFRQKNYCPHQKHGTVCCESIREAFCLTKAHTQKCEFFMFCKIVHCGFSQKRTQTWIKPWIKPRSRSQNANVD